jgi:elongation factor Tu
MPVRYTDAPFLLPVENVLTITGRGTVVTGASSAAWSAGRQGGPGRRPRRDAVQRGHRRGDLRQADGVAQAGDNVALLLRSIDRGQVRRG